MASSPTSIENQIDSFLEQFKRSASRAMEETAAHHHRSSSYNACSSSISRSRSGNLDLDLLEAGKFVRFDRSAGGREPEGREKERECALRDHSLTGYTRGFPYIFSVVKVLISARD